MLSGPVRCEVGPRPSCLGSAAVIICWFMTLFSFLGRRLQGSGMLSLRGLGVATVAVVFTGDFTSGCCCCCCLCVWCQQLRSSSCRSVVVVLSRCPVYNLGTFLSLGPRSQIESQSCDCEDDARVHDACEKRACCLGCLRRGQCYSVIVMLVMHVILYCIARCY